MIWLRRVLAVTRGLFRRNVVAGEIREEMRLHVEMRAEEYRRQGLDPIEAQRAAQRQFGNPAVLQDAGYDVRGAGVWDSVSQDARYAARRLRAAPAFTATAVLTLALGIGANSAIFSLVNGVMLRGTPGTTLDRVAAVVVTRQGVPFPMSGLTNHERQSLEAQHLDAIESFFTSDPLLGAAFAGESHGLVTAELVSGTYASSLGLVPLEGRLLGPDDDRDVGGATPVVISERLRRSWFGGRAAVGSVLRMAGAPLTVVGVMPAAFRGTWLPTIMAADLWIPAVTADRLRTVQGTPVSGPHRTFARLRPGTSITQTDAAVRAVTRSVLDDAERGLRLGPAERAISFDDFVRPGLAIGSGVVALSTLVFLIACANLTNLLLARAVSRSGEMATRLALGASRSRVFRLLFMEAVLVTAMAGAGAVVMTVVVTTLMVRVPLPQLDGISIRFDPSPDWRVFGYAFVAAVGAALVVGLTPAWRASRTDPLRTLAAAGRRGMESNRGRRLRAALVTAQVAMSIVLLLTAGLYLRSSMVANRFDPGYEIDHAAVASVDLRYSKLDEPAGRRIQQQMLVAANRIPGVTRAVLTSGLTPTGSFKTTAWLVADGQSLDARGTGLFAQYADVSPGTLAALGIRLNRGRDFTEADEAGAPGVAIVSESVATRCWPKQDPLGRRFRLDRKGPLLEVVGVATAVSTRLGRGRYTGQFVYLPIAQDYSPQVSAIAVTAGDPRALVEPLRRAVQMVDSDLAVTEAQTLAASFGTLLGALNATLLIFGSLGVLGFGIAVIGLHGVTTYFVSQRTREFGIRRALGATSAGIYAVVLRSGSGMLLAGAAIGVPIAFAASGLLRNLLYGITPHDPATFVAVPLLLVAVGLASSCLAARRAARIEPADALRDL